MRLILPIACLALLAGHDAQRKNPFDPVLTPAVDGVQATLDDSAGITLLQWEPYEGSQPFREYRVLRKEQGLERVDTLVVLADRSITTYTDTSLLPGSDYEYQVAVLNQAGFVVPGATRPIRSFELSSVALHAVIADSLSGVIGLRWGRYRGPGFEGYKVLRERVGEVVELAVVADPADTTWADTTAVPFVDYFYWIRLSRFGEELDSSTEGISLGLPPVDITSAEFHSPNGTADIAWTPYVGPRFEAYEVRRQADGDLGHTVLSEIDDVANTAFIDSSLVGNTSYRYWIFTRTTWGSETGSESVAQRGIIYPLIEEVVLPVVSDSQVQSMGVAVDETISFTSA